MPRIELRNGKSEDLTKAAAAWNVINDIWDGSGIEAEDYVRELYLHCKWKWPLTQKIIDKLNFYTLVTRDGRVPSAVKNVVLSSFGDSLTNDKPLLPFSNNTLKATDQAKLLDNGRVLVYPNNYKELFDYYAKVYAINEAVVDIMKTHGFEFQEKPYLLNELYVLPFNGGVAFQEYPNSDAPFLIQTALGMISYPDTKAPAEENITAAFREIEKRFGLVELKHIKRQTEGPFTGTIYGATKDAGGNELPLPTSAAKYYGANSFLGASMARTDAGLFKEIWEKIESENPSRHNPPVTPTPHSTLRP